MGRVYGPGYRFLRGAPLAPVLEPKPIEPPEPVPAPVPVSAPVPVPPADRAVRLFSAGTNEQIGVGTLVGGTDKVYTRLEDLEF